jgi:hypothetical protein
VATPAWERQDGEPAAAYQHFATFRDLGVDRSRDAAYRVYMRGQGQEVADTAEAPGTWTRECRRWSWVERAAVWDGRLARLQAATTVCRMTKFVDTYAAKLLEALERADAPADWKEITEAAQALAGWVPPELNGRLPRGDEPWQPPPANRSPARLEPPGSGDTADDQRNDRPGDRPAAE